jgi:hypothetical protein
MPITGRCLSPSGIIEVFEQVHHLKTNLMNNIFKSALAASLMLFAGSLPIVTNAQITANVSLSGNLNGNLGANNYSGFPINSLYHVQLVTREFR